MCITSACIGGHNITSGNKCSSWTLDSIHVIKQTARCHEINGAESKLRNYMMRMNLWLKQEAPSTQQKRAQSEAQELTNSKTTRKIKHRIASRDFLAQHGTFSAKHNTNF